MDVIMSKLEFRTAMGRLGLGLATSKYDLLFDRVDLNSDGAINMGQFMAWVSGAQMEGPCTKIDFLRSTIHKHLGSPTNAFLWFLKKHKLPESQRALTNAQFEQFLRRDLPAVFERPIRFSAAEAGQV
jgi:hypothetical protein